MKVSLIRELSSFFSIVQYGTLGADSGYVYVVSQQWASETPTFYFRRYVYHLQIKLQAYPDVAAQGDNSKIFLNGQATLMGGTSCAAPTFIGFFSLLNDARLSVGRRSLGFLNPFLYSIGVGCLNDITIGHNSGCGTQGFNVSQP